MFSQELLEIAAPYLLALAICIARPLGMVFTSAVFNWFNMGNIQKFSLALILSTLTFQISFEFVELTPELGITLIAVLGIEFLVGLAMGTAISIPIYAAQYAGDVIDQYRASSVASDFDTNQSVESTILGKFYTIAALMLFVNAGGIHAGVAGVISSYAIWPLTSLLPEFSWEAATACFRLLDQIFRVGLIMCAPIIIPMVLVDIGLMFAARAGQQFNPFELSLTIKNLVVVFMLVVAIGPTVTGMWGSVGQASSLPAWFLEALR